MDRYNRNILCEGIGKKGQDKLSALKVLVCGAGGLGSVVIQNLAGMGIENIGIVDKDRVELSNLNRQTLHSTDTLEEYKTDSAQKWIEAYNPYIKIEKYTFDFNLACAQKILKNYDIVMDCFDSFKSKLALNKACVSMSRPLVHMGVSDLSGQVFFIEPGQSPCLACLLEEKPEEDDRKGIIAPIVNIIGSLGCIELLNFVLFPDRLEKGLIIIYDSKKREIKKVRAKINAGCRVCNV